MPRRKQAQPKEPQFAMNWQRKARVVDKIPRYNFDGAVVADDLLSLTLQDNTTLSSGDYCYVVNTVGEPFAIGRIMEFISTNAEADSFEARYSVRLNWLYRPSSINKKAQNTREVLLTMHSEIISLDSLRPKVTIMNRHEIEDLDKFISKPNCFWFDRYWDRYISRFFDVIPSSHVTNIPPELGPIIRLRYKYLILEPQRTKQLTEAPQFCSVCDLWCSEADSVHCVDCDQFFHRGCTTPPIAHPLKGYSWTCGSCALAHEALLEKRRGPDLTMRRKRSPLSAEKQQIKDQREAEVLARKAETERLIDQEHKELRKLLVPECKEIEQAIAQHSIQDLTQSQIRYREIWPFRYFGVNTNLKDIFDIEDSIHPRAISRVGNKHQAVVQDWPGKPVVYYRKIVPDRPKRGPRSKNVNKETIRYEPDDLDMTLPWVQEAPAGYIERGSSETSTLMWSPDCDNAPGAEKFLEKTHNYAEAIGIHHYSANFLDACLYNYMGAANESEALTTVGLLTKKSLKEPSFSPKEIDKFERAVTVHGNNLHQVFKVLKTKSSADVVRFYYLWKKTEGGHRVWDNCQARMSKHSQPTQNEEFMHSIRDTSDPILSYSSDMVKKLSKSLFCKFCEAVTSREWRAAPHSVIDPDDDLIEALCSRCSRIWYRYAIEWMEPDVVIELNASKYTRPRVDPELLEDAIGILNERDKFLQKKKTQHTDNKKPTKATKRASDAVKKSPSKRRRTQKVKYEDGILSSGQSDEDSSQVSEGGDTDVKSNSEVETGTEDEDDEDEEIANEGDIGQDSTTHEDSEDGEVKKEEPTNVLESNIEEAVTVPGDELVGADDADDAEESSESSGSEENDADSRSIMRSKEASYSYVPNYCAVCSQCDPSLSHLTCQSCFLSVHAKCYGFLSKPITSTPWYCDCCLNDKDNFADHIYQCDLCPVKLPNYAAWLSGELTGIPDALKRTWDGKWSHIRCALWSPNILFQDSNLLQQVEIYPHNTEECSLCHMQGICINCTLCPQKFHPGCAGCKGFAMGILFKETPDGPVSWEGKTGTMETAVICDAHENPDTVPGLLPMSDIDTETELTAMQTFARFYKQAAHPEISGSLRRSLLHPGTTSEAVLVIPSTYVDSEKEGDPLTFFQPDTNICMGCQTTQSPYWIQYPEKYTRCCNCYWKLKDGTADKGVDSQQIIENMWKIFDATVGLPRQAQARSMRIKDILS